MRRIWKHGRKKAMKEKGVTSGNYHKGPSSFKKDQRQRRRTKEKQAIQQGKELFKVPKEWYL